MRTKTTIYREEDTKKWFVRMKAITGMTHKELLHNAVKLYAAVLSDEAFLTIDGTEFEAVKRVLIDFVESPEPVCLPKRFD